MTFVWQWLKIVILTLNEEKSTIVQQGGEWGFLLLRQNSYVERKSLYLIQPTTHDVMKKGCKERNKSLSLPLLYHIACVSDVLTNWNEYFVEIQEGVAKLHKYIQLEKKRKGFFYEWRKLNKNIPVICNRRPLIINWKISDRVCASNQRNWTSNPDKLCN